MTPRPDDLELAARLLRPHRSTKAIEDVECLAEREARRPPLLAAAKQAASREPCPAELEGKARCLLQVERVKCASGRRSCRPLREHVRSCARQSNVGPQPWEYLCSLLESHQGLTGTVDLTQVHEQLDVKGLRYKVQKGASLMPIASNRSRIWISARSAAR